MSSKQGGGIVGFVVVAVVLAGLLAGGLYFSKNQARVARESNTTTPITTTSDANKAKSKNESSRDDTAPAPSTRSDRVDSKESTEADHSLASDTPASQPRVAATGPSDEIPATGPREAAVAIIGATLLAFAATAVVRARRRLASAALR
ncbi:hypothetical protein E6P97_04350 [Patescibacteria group bacterium]|nr:MAG: hypothetical protein E6P97_04350 [Patescibacteria group bacterium]